MDKQKAFILSIKDAAVSACKGAQIFPSIVIAQACLESNYGLSGLSLNCNNFFGIKAGSKWKGPTRIYKTNEYSKTQGRMIKVDAAFAVYKDFQECLAEHNAMIHRVPAYTNAGLFKCTSAQGQANALRKAGYATDPAYPQKLMAIVNQYNLTQYDTMPTGESVPFYKEGE